MLGREAFVSDFVCMAYGGTGEGVVRVHPDGDRWRFGADLDFRDTDGLNALDRARVNGHEEIVKIFEKAHKNE